MEETNPYSPPATIDSELLPEERPEYAPLRGRARLVAFAIALNCAMSLLVDIVFLLAAGVDLESNIGLAFGMVGGWVVMILTMIFSAVAYCVWLYAAARNTRLMGEELLQASPGWCVGSFFVPLANLYLPFRNAREIYEMSDPARVGAGAPAKRPDIWLLQVWWGTWIVANILGYVVSMQLDDFSVIGALGLVASVLLAVAGVSAVKIAYVVADGQERIFSERQRLGLGSA